MILLYVLQIWLFSLRNTLGDHFLTWLSPSQFAERKFGLSTYLDQSSTEVRSKYKSKYILRPKYVLKFGLGVYLDHTFELDFRSAKLLHFLAYVGT